MVNEILFIEDVMKITRLSRPTIRIYIKDNDFPKPFKVGNRNAWYGTGINKWIVDQMGVARNE